MKISICFIVFSFILLYVSFYFASHKPDPYLLSKVGEKIELRGTVLSEPIEKPKSTQVVASTEFGKVLLFANSFPKVAYGDEILFSAKLKRPESFVTDNGITFNYPGYLSKDGIYFTESYPAIKILSSQNGNPIKEKLYELKYLITKGMEKVVPYPESALLEGITVAGKRALPEEINDEFKIAGVSHIVVLSGYNVTIVVLIIIKLLSRFPRKVAFGAATFGIAAFCIMAGGSSTIVRAGIMSFLFLVGKFGRRSANANKLLFITGILMVLYNPLILLYDPSFHLSFLATFGLINISPLFHRRLKIFTEDSVLREIIATSLAVEIFLIPYLLYSIGAISLVALPANILLLAFIPATMGIGFISSVLSFVFTSFARIPALISFVLLRYELGIVHFMASFPHVLMKITAPWWFAVTFYLSSFAVFLTHQIVLKRQANLDSQRMLQRISPSQMADNLA